MGTSGSFLQPGRSNREGNAEDFLIEGLTVPPTSMIIELFAVIGSEYDDCVVIESEFSEYVEKLAHIRVCKRNFAVVLTCR